MFTTISFLPTETTEPSTTCLSSISVRLAEYSSSSLALSSADIESSELSIASQSKSSDGCANSRGSVDVTSFTGAVSSTASTVSSTATS